MHFKSLLGVAALAATAAAQEAPMMNLTALLASTPELTALTSLITADPGLVSALSAAQNITILAPSNEALGAVLNSTAGQALATTPGAIQAVLTYHVLNGSFPASAITNTSVFVPTLLANASFTNVTGGQVVEAVALDGNVTFFSGLKLNTTVSQADLNFTGGVIHVVDSLLTIPLNVSATAVAANLTAAAGALASADLVDTVDTLPDVTIFVPNNDAFSAIGSVVGNLSVEDLTSILTYHVVNGSVIYSTDITENTTVPTLQGGSLSVSVVNGSVYVNQAQVILPDVLVAGGVVHVIDGVLNPNNTSASRNGTSATPAFSGASSATSGGVPFTSAAATPTSTVPAGGSATTGAAASTSSGAGVPMMTAAADMAALLGGAAMLLNW